MSFSLGQFIGGAAAAGVSNADEAIKHRDALDLQSHQDDAAMMRQTALANLQHGNSVDLMHQTSDNAVTTAEQVRQAKSDRIENNANGIIQQAQLSKWNKTNDIDTGEVDKDGNPITRQATADDIQSGKLKLDDGDVDLKSDPDSQLSEHDQTMAHLQAEAKDTGDYTKLATLANSSENMQVKWDAMKSISDNKDATRQYIADQQNATRAAQIQMMATVAGIRASVSAGKSDQNEVFKTMNSIDADIRSNQKEISTNAFLLGTINKSDPRFAMINADNDRLKAAIQENTAAKRSIAQSAGIKLPSAPVTTAPAAATQPVLNYDPTTGKFK